MNLFNENTEGIFYGVPDAEYRKAPGISQTYLKEIGRSPAHYAELVEHPTEATPAMIFGRIAHHVLLTPEVPYDWAIQPPGLDGRTKEGKDWKKANEGKAQIKHDDWLRVEGAVASARCHPLIKTALAESRAEVSWFRQFSLGGRVLRKGRVDLLPPGRALVDFKFVEDARCEPFSKDILNFKYYMQAPYYLDGVNENLTSNDTPKDTFVLFAIEKEPPFAIASYQLSPKAIEKGRAEYIENLTRVIECQSLGEWSVFHPRSSYSPDFQMIDLPKYATKRDLIYA